MQVTEKDELLQAKERELAEAQQTLQSIEALLAANFKKTLQQRDSSDENMDESSSSHAKRPKLQVKAIDRPEWRYIFQSIANIASLTFHGKWVIYTLF